MKSIFAAMVFGFASLVYASPATRLEFQTASQSIPENTCAQISIVTENGALQPTPVTKSTIVTVSGNGLSFYNNVSCTVKSSTFTITAGSDSGSFYTLGASEGTFLINATAPGLNAQTQKETIIAPVAPACTGEQAAPINPPSQVVSAGLNNLVFDDEFNSLDVNWSSSGGSGYNWYAWNPDGSALTESQVTLNNGCLTINSSQNNYSFGLSTIDSLTPSSGFWQVPFYFEARMQSNPQGWTTTGEGWPAFWSYSINALNNTFPSTELDVVELYPPGPGGSAKGKTNGVYELNTIHQWTSSSANTQNTPDNPTLPSTFDYSAFHIYGVLVTSNEVTWYIDNAEVLSVPVGSGTKWTTIESDKMPLIIGTGKNWPTTFDYVHVWQ